MYTVYIHVFPNGKRYVGVTSCKPHLRWGSNGCNYKNPYIKNAIAKYGWDSVEHQIIAEGLSAEQASQMEIELIEKYNSADRKFGYNISLGGIENKICSDETKEKLRQANLGKIMSDESKAKISKAVKGRIYSEEVRANMSKAQKKSYANGNNALHSKEARKKASLSLKGRKPSPLSIQKANEAKFRSVKSLITGKEYKSIKDACADTGVDRTTISRHCNGKTKKKDWEYVEGKRK